MSRTGPALVMGMGLLCLSLSPTLRALDGPGKEGKKKQKPKTALEFKVKNIDGKPVDLRKFLGKVVVVVNVASQ